MKLDTFSAEAQSKADKLTELEAVKRQVSLEHETDPDLLSLTAQREAVLDEQAQLMGHPKPWTKDEALQAAKRLEWLNARSIELKAEINTIDENYSKHLIAIVTEINEIVMDLESNLGADENNEGNQDGLEYIRGIRGLVVTLNAYDQDLRSKIVEMGNLEDKMDAGINKVSQRIIESLFKMPDMNEAGVVDEFRKIDIWYEVIDQLSSMKNKMLQEYKASIKEIRAQITSIIERLSDQSLNNVSPAGLDY